MNTLSLQIPPSIKFTDEEFEQIVEFNKELRLELTASGELIIMSPTGGETGNRNFEIYTDLGIWNRKKKLGKVKGLLPITDYQFPISITITTI